LLKRDLRKYPIGKRSSIGFASGQRPGGQDGI
jgi:hypothetical protein